MSSDFGACVVLIPEENDLPNDLEGGQHITLAYFGDYVLPSTQYNHLLDIVSYMAANQTSSIEAYPLSYEMFGPDENAHVLTFSNVPLEDIRNDLLDALTPELTYIFKAAETFPDYRPHMTLGYTDTGYIPETMDVPAPIKIKGLAVWNGDKRIEFPLTTESLMHIGVLRKSGRYPWGSGETPNQRHKDFLNYVDDLKKKGMTEPEIAKAFGAFSEDGRGISTTELRANKKIAKNELKKAEISEAMRLSEKQMSNVAIGKQMGKSESYVRSLLDPATKANNEKLVATANMLRNEVAKKEFLDVGVGTENHLNISSTQLATAVAQLREEGYSFHRVEVEQLGTGKFTKMKVLAGPDVPYIDVVRNPGKIKPITDYTEDGGHSFESIAPPVPISSKRVAVRYAEEGGGDMDGVIQLRRGVDDISLGDSKYAQVRISVDGTHYLKGMAMYTDDLPDGIDMRFNTNKSDTGNKLKAMKPIKDDADPSNPFGSVVRQKHYIDSNGEKKLSPLNIVNEEGVWATWSKNLSSQMLSKQTPELAKQQLGLSFDMKKAEYDEIMALTNPTIKKKLLEAFSDGADSSAVHLKAAGLPRTGTHVILPVPELKENEIYAPKYRDGERVVLIRHPHGGTFEIPELTVNNRNTAAKRVMGQARDAVGIHPKTAVQLSGADFDGDTVLVIPNNQTGVSKVRIAPMLAGLKDFNPQEMYKGYEGMPKMSARTKGHEMGNISNLITDMSVKEAPHALIARAVRHSMVVIDAEKHNLNYKQSAKDHGIAELKAKYQGGANKGANTLISQASSSMPINKRKPRSAKNGGPIDPLTGKLMYEETGESYIKSKTNKRTGVVTEEVIYKTDKSTRMAETDDAHTLSTGRTIENVYANHANKLKALANTARKEMITTKGLVRSPSAAVAYAPQVQTLKAKLNVALRNAPIERQAQNVANTIVHAKKQANPNMEPEELKKIKGLALTEARLRTGADKKRIEITPIEWEAIQSGAISNNFLDNILSNTDLDKVKALATPRNRPAVSTALVSRAKSMLASGYTQADIADALGVPTSTLNDALYPKEG